MLATSSSDEDETTNNNAGSKFLASSSPAAAVATSAQQQQQTFSAKSPQKIAANNQPMKQNLNDNNQRNGNMFNLMPQANNIKVASNGNNNNNYASSNITIQKNHVLMTSNDSRSINSINSYSASSDDMNALTVTTTSAFTTQPNTPSSSIKYKKKLPTPNQQSLPQQQQSATFQLQHGGSIKSNTLSIQSVSTNRSTSGAGGGSSNTGGVPRNNRSSSVRRTSSPNASYSSKYDDDDDEDENVNDNSSYNYEQQQQQYQQNNHDNDDEMDSFIMGSKDYKIKQQLQQQQQQLALASKQAAQQQQELALNELQNQEALKEIEDHKKRLQVYVFVCRCIAYSFIAKQPTDMVRRQFKITKQQLQQIKDNFESFLSGKMQIEADEAFTNAVRSYYEVFLKSDRISKMVSNGGCSNSDFRDVFKNNIEKRVRSLPEIDGLSKETVLTSWTAKFDAIFKGNDDLIGHRRQSKHHFSNSATTECILSKEQLYDMFQNILGIKKFEHQLIFNAAQLDNADEQAATIRRELDSRMKQAENIQKQHSLMPKFVHKNMESTYIEELKQSISLLMNQLDNQPVGASESKLRLPKRPQHSSKADGMDEHETDISKLDVVLNFAIEVIVMEVKGLKSLPPHRIVFCVMELEGHNKLQTDQAEASRPIWDTSGDFKTQQPLPVIKVKLCMETQNILQDNKELGRVVIKADPNFTRAPVWYVMEKANQKFPDDLKIKLTIRFDKPANLKMCGWCYCMGKNIWKKWKKRYLCLVQVSQYTFVLCSYMEKKSEPKELMTLDNFTVDYTDFDLELKVLGGKFFFNAVKEGDNVSFATEEETERQLWVQALYRATGQSHKPTPPSAIKSPQLAREQGDVDRARKHGMEEFIQADPSTFSHNDLFKTLQASTLSFRLNDPYCCLGWFGPGQIFVLDEYQARYGVRGCFRHLCYLSDLLDRGEQAYIIDPTLLHYSFAFCACHVHGNRPDGIGTVTVEEKTKFDEIKERLRNLLEYQITNFRYCFPFGRPEGALKQTLSLLERVLMKDIVTPVTPEEVKSVIRKCLENAALVNYTRISQTAKVEGEKDPNVEENESLYNSDTTPKKKVEDLIHLAELCIDLLQQNEEHHAEAFAWFSELLIEHEEIFWSLFAVDMDHVIEQQMPDSWDSFPLFQLLNDYLRNHPSLRDGRFHRHLQDIFAPLVIRYVDLMESSIGQSIHKGFEKESWKSRGQGCATSEDMLWKLDALQAFIKDLHWPDEIFAEHLEHRLKQMASDMIEACSSRVLRHFDSWMKRGAIIGGNGTDYTFPNECCVMVDVIIDCKAQALKLCSLNSGDLHRYHTKIDEFLERSLAEMSKQLVNKLVSVLDTILKKLSRYDEGSFFAPILSLTKPVNELGQSYVTFLCSNLEQLRQKINDELFILNIFERWYTEQVNMICAWLSDRLDISLHPYQLACLSLISKKIKNNYELQGVTEKVLDSKTYQTILNRLNVEEANQALR